MNVRNMNIWIYRAVYVSFKLWMTKETVQSALLVFFLKKNFLTLPWQADG